MRKWIGTIAILGILYLGFFGCEKYKIKPFILNWITSAEGRKTVKQVKKVVKKTAQNVEDTVENVVDALIVEK